MDNSASHLKFLLSINIIIIFYGLLLKKYLLLFNFMKGVWVLANALNVMTVATEFNARSMRVIFNFLSFQLQIELFYFE